MIKFLRTVALRNSFIRLISYSKSNQKEGQLQKKEEQAIVEKKGDYAVMEDNFQKVKMKGLEGRDIAGVDDFQKQILDKNKFDLLDPKIQPKVASLSTTMGLQVDQNQLLTEINLGKIKVKKQNEVFLSEVDPTSIPEYYDIVFDSQKEMSLVGRQAETLEGDKSEGDMAISTRKAFEQRSQRQLSDQILGIRIDPFQNTRVVWKTFIAALITWFLIFNPFLVTFAQKLECQRSIQQIQNERMSQIDKIKKQALGQVILKNKEMKLI